MHEPVHQIRRAADCFAISIIFASREHPRRHIHFCELLLKTSRETLQASVLFTQTLLQRHRTKRSSRHALTVDRIKCTNSITEQQEVFWQRLRAFITTQTVLRGAMRLDWRSGLSDADGVVDHGHRKVVCKIEKTFFI